MLSETDILANLHSCRQCLWTKQVQVTRSEQSMNQCIHCIRGFTTMRYINRLFTYWLTYLLVRRAAEGWAIDLYIWNLWCYVWRKTVGTIVTRTLMHGLKQRTQHLKQFSLDTDYWLYAWCFVLIFAIQRIRAVTDDDILRHSTDGTVSRNET